MRPLADSATTSTTTILHVADMNSSTVLPRASDLVPERLRISPRNTSQSSRPTMQEFDKLDGGSGAPGNSERGRHGNLNQDVMVKRIRKRPAGPRPLYAFPGRSQSHVLGDNIALPTDATKAVCQMLLRDVVAPDSSPNWATDQTRQLFGPSVPKAYNTEKQPSWTNNSGSASPTVVQAFLLVHSRPQRQRTLRHVQKTRTLRDVTYAHPDQGTTGASPRSVDPSPSPVDRLPVAEQPVSGHQHAGCHSSLAPDSLSSGRARRQVWKNGGVPVVVVPERRSSSKPKEPSLRSTSSRWSKRSVSANSTLRDASLLDNVRPRVADRQPRASRSRPVSESGPLDQRTIDFPPAIPPRSSSLSAPTSRNASRATSLTADSLKTLSRLYQPSVVTPEECVVHTIEHEPNPLPEVDVHPSSPTRLEAGGAHDVFCPGQLDDGGSPKRFSSRDTPFSIASFETIGTAPELSEALAVHMHLHQNSSVLMVHHSTKPAELPDIEYKEANAHEPSSPPGFLTTSPDDGGPLTPPWQPGSADVLDSPLRNPRPPPQPPKDPPEINFIPATPSGATPAHERLVQLGNYFEATGERPPRRPSIVRRAFSRRRHSIDYPPSASRAPVPGFLTRTFSLSRISRAGAIGRGNQDMHPSYPQEEDKPSDADRLHPFWRPQWPDEESAECQGGCDQDDHYYEEIYRYPPLDNRPRMPRRSLSARMKKTFAIFPVRDDEYYPADSSEGPDRCTIRRTPSGNLKVMRHRSSMGSLKRREGMIEKSRPWAGDGSGRHSQHAGSLRRRTSRERVRRAPISRRLEGIQDIPRMLGERRREKRTRELRQMISGPKEVRDGVDEVTKPASARVRQCDSNAAV